MTFAQPSRNGMIGDAVRIADELTTRIRDAANARPRNLQTAVGPSGVGVPCDLQLAYAINAWPACNGDRDPLASSIGTAFHAQLDEWFANLDEKLPDGRPRWVTEQRLEIRTGLWGSCDLYDRHTKAVLDWKVQGDWSYKKLKAEGPSQQYRVQANLYGLGYARLGEQVERVGIVSIPKGGRLDGLYVWCEPYDEAFALAALERYDNITIATVGLDVAEHPERFAYIPRKPSRACRFCDWYSPGTTDFSRGCAGDSTPTPSRSSK